MNKQPDQTTPTKRSPRRRRRLAIVIAVCLILVGVGYFVFRERDPYVPPQMIKRPDRKPDEASHPLDKALDIAYRQKAHMIDTVRDYTAKIVKRERIRGKLGQPQTLFVKIRSRKRDKETEQITAPMSVYLRFLEPAGVAGREVIWVEGKNDNKLVAHEAGFKNFFRANLAPTSLIAMLGNKYPITEIGIENLLDKLIIRGEEGRRHKDTKVTVSANVDFRGRKCTVIEVVHPEKRKEFTYHLARIHLDQKLGIPIKYASFLWPEKEGGELPLEEEYFYDEVKTNIGLVDKDFDPDNPDYNYPGKKK